jgi:hypothetical protein
MEKIRTNDGAPVFPVTRKIANKALAEIMKDPDEAMRREQEHMRYDNPYLLAFFEKDIISGNQSMKEAFLWTYRILRKQSEEKGEQLVKIPEGIIAQYRSEIQPNMRGLRTKDGLEKIDPTIVMAIERMTIFRTDKLQYYTAAFHLASIVKRTIDEGNKK